MKRGLAAVALVAVLVGAAWWLWPSSDVVAEKDASKADAGSSPASSALDRAAVLEHAEVDAGPPVKAWLTVVNAVDGKPVLGAEVELDRVEEDQRVPPHIRRHQLIEEALEYRSGRRSRPHAVTDVAGRAEFEVPQSARFEVRIEASYFEHHHGPFVSGDTVALSPLPLVHGKVVNDRGRPVAGAKVSSLSEVPASALTNAQGRFELPVPDLSELFAEKDGQFGRAELPEALTDEVQIELTQPEGEVTGRVSDTAGKPIAGAEIVLELGSARVRRTSAQDGAFGLPLLEDLEGWLTISRQGYVTLREEYSTYGEYEVVLRRPARIEGLLVEPDGRPLPGLEVHAEVRPGEYDLAPDRQKSAVTDAQGRFTFAGLGDAFIVLYVSTEAGRTASEVVALEEEKTVRKTLVLRPVLATVPVEVVSITGRKVNDYSLVATPVPSRGWTSSASARAPLELDRGRFHFQVESDDGRTCEDTREVNPAADMAPLVFVVRGDGGQQYEDELPPERVRVLAVTPTGVPVSDAMVECYDIKGSTGPDGRFECDVRGRDHAWPIYVVVRKAGEIGQARATGKEAEVRVVVSPRKALRGRIVGTLPLGENTVRVRTREEDRHHPIDGNTFELENRPALRHYLCVETSPIGDKLGDSTELGCAVSEAGEDVVIVVGEQGTLRFAALDDTGAPLTNPLMYVDRIEQDGSGEVIDLKTSPGDHVLVLNDGRNRARHETRFVIRPGQVTDLGKLQLK